MSKNVYMYRIYNLVLRKSRKWSYTNLAENVTANITDNITENIFNDA